MAEENKKLARPVTLPAVVGGIGPLADLMSVKLRRVDNLLARSFAATTTGRDLRSGMISSLALIAANPGVCQNDIALSTGIDKAAIVAIINRLEELGWAVRTRSERDKRRQTLHVTPKGEAELAQITAELRKIEDALLAKVSREDLEQLSLLLDRAHESCLAALG